jgi:hypothetical protein
VGKPIDINQAEKVLKQSHELGIWNEIELISGMPHETEEDIGDTLGFVERNQKYVNFFYINSFILKGSMMLKYPQRFGITNIRHSKNDTFDLRYVGWEFDEEGGLKWKDKRKQQIDSFNRVYEAIKPTNDMGTDIHTVFYAYSNLNR